MPYKQDHIKVLKVLAGELPKRPSMKTSDIVEKSFKRDEDGDRRVRNAYRMLRKYKHIEIAERGDYRLTQAGVEFYKKLSANGFKVPEVPKKVVKPVPKVKKATKKAAKPAPKKSAKKVKIAKAKKAAKPAPKKAAKPAAKKAAPKKVAKPNGKPAPKVEAPKPAPKPEASKSSSQLTF